MVLADTSEAFIRCARAAFEFVQRLRTTNRLARARRDLWHDILISTMEERAKVKAVERNPHVSICVLDEKWPPTYLQVFGEAMIDRDPDVVFDVAVRGVELMSGSKVPEELHETIREGIRRENRVVIRLRPTSTFYTPPRHTYKAEDVRGLTHTTSQSVPW